MLGTDHLPDLGDPFGGQRVRAEIAGQHIDGDARHFVLRSGRRFGAFLQVLFVEPLERLENAHAAQGGISGVHGEAGAFAVGLHLLLLAVAGDEDLGGQCDQTAQRDAAERHFDLDALGAMVMVDVLELVAEDGSQLVFGFHKIHQPAADKHVTAGKREGVDEMQIRR